MGNGNWMPEEFKSTATVRASQTQEQVFTARAMSPDIDPRKFVVRESRDSTDHPNSTAVVVGFDVTGSMGVIPEYFAKTALGQLMDELLKKKPVPDPQLLVAAVGDSHIVDYLASRRTVDKAPLQVGQFESDNRIDKWLTGIFLEGGGGGNGGESYGLVYHFAGTRTSIDCMEKRGQKGFLFTVGDEAPHPNMDAEEFEVVFGDAEARPVSLTGAIASASALYDVIHVLVESESYSTEAHERVWRDHLGRNVLILKDYRALPELIMTTIGVRAGMRLEDATRGFGPAANALVLRSGVDMLAARTAGGIVRL